MRSRDSNLKKRSQKVRLAITIAALGLVGVGSLSCVGAVDNDGGADESESGGSGPSTGAASSSGGKKGVGGSEAGGAVGSTGGVGPAGGAFGVGGSTSGGEAGQPGTGGLGGSSTACEQPFDAGPCSAAFRVYFHNSQTDLCELAVYGGCGGNDNRFETLSACEQACGAVRSGRACSIEGVVYPSGSSNVPHPSNCNTCSCDDGELTACTERDCPELCPQGSIYGTDCAECGPTDACLTVRHACLPACGPELECSAGFCSDGICREGLCG